MTYVINLLICRYSSKTQKPMQTVGNNEDRTCTVDCGEEKNVELSLLQNAENDTAEQRHQSIIRIPCGIFFAMTSTLRVCFPLEREAQASSEHKLFDTSLFRNMPFLFYAISFSLLTMAMKSATIFFPALSMSRGLSSSQAAYLLSISGVVETISRLLSGFILEMPCIRSRRPVVYNGILVVIALVLPVMPLLQDFSHFAIIHSVYALLTGMILSQKCVILLDILGNEKMSSSFGLLIAFQGFGVVTGPPLSGRWVAQR